MHESTLDRVSDWMTVWSRSVGAAVEWFSPPDFALERAMATQMFIRAALAFLPLLGWLRHRCNFALVSCVTAGRVLSQWTHYMDSLSSGSGFLHKFFEASSTPVKMGKTDHQTIRNRCLPCRTMVDTVRVRF
jgi:hypothetical protein